MKNTYFISHATKDFSKVESVLEKGKLVSPQELLNEKLISKKDIFNYYGDKLIRRINNVMFSLGLGYILKHKDMPVSFLFSLNTIKKGSQLHIKPLLYEKCLVIARKIKQQDKKTNYWINYFKTHKLDKYNHPRVSISFSKYMIHFLSNPKIKTYDNEKDKGKILAYKDAWGPSVYPKGLIEICLNKNPDNKLKLEIKKKLTLIDKKLIIKDVKKIKKFLKKNYKNKKYSYMEILVPKFVDIWSGNLVGFYVRKKYLKKFNNLLNKYKPKNYNEIY